MTIGTGTGNLVVSSYYWQKGTGNSFTSLVYLYGYVRQYLFFWEEQSTRGNIVVIGLVMLVFPLCICYVYCITCVLLFGFGLAERLRV